MEPITAPATAPRLESSPTGVTREYVGFGFDESVVAAGKLGAVVAAG